MTDLNTMTKDALNALLAAPLTASQLKKKSKADLIAMFDAMPAADVLDADLRDARADDTPPTEPTLGEVVQNLASITRPASIHSASSAKASRSESAITPISASRRASSGQCCAARSYRNAGGSKLDKPGALVHGSFS